jgi:hypothetical protein
METKHCPDCGTQRPVSEFYKIVARYDGLSSYCRKHQLQRDNQRHREHPEKRRAYSKKYNDKVRAAREAQKPAPVQPPAIHALVCPECGGSFVQKRGGQKYCNPKCTNAAWYSRADRLISVEQVRREEGLNKPKPQHVCRAYPPFGHCVCGRSVPTAASAGGGA